MCGPTLVTALTFVSDAPSALPFVTVHRSGKLDTGKALRESSAETVELLQTKLSNLQLELRRKEKSVGMLQGKLDLVEQTHNDAVDGEVAELERKVAVLKGQLSEKERIVEESHLQIAELEESLETAEQRQQTKRDEIMVLQVKPIPSVTHSACSTNSIASDSVVAAGLGAARLAFMPASLRFVLAPHSLVCLPG